MLSPGLIWEKISKNKIARTKIEKLDVNLFNELDWPAMNEFVVTQLPTFERASGPFIKIKNRAEF